MSEEKKSGWSLGMWLFLALVGMFFVGLTMPVVIRSEKKAPQTQAVNNARQIGIALFEFETAYGSYPDETTAPKVRLKTGTQLDLGNTSANDYFRQLVAAQLLVDDRPFFAETAFIKKSGMFGERRKRTLEPGTVGFGYLMNDKSAFTSVGNPARTLACAPLAFDGKSVSSQKFEFDRYNGKAVVLRIDNSVASLPIQKDTSLATLGGGKTLLESGPETIWGGKDHPVIVAPLPKR